MPQFCAGIVTFEPDIERLKNCIEQVIPQVEKLIIVDNHSSNIQAIRVLLMPDDKITLIENKNNEGIAKALNQLCEYANDNGFSWIITLDQDTIVPDDMIDIFSHYTGYSENGIICPNVFYDGWDKNVIKSDTTQYIKACMTSASLTRIEAWKAVGGFREDYFIDFVDNEFCMKLHINRYKILRVNSCCINHRLGDSGVKKFCGLKIKYSRHSPVRLYYMARNNSVFINEYRAYLPVIKERVKLLYVLFFGILFSKHIMAGIKMVYKGLYDARNGKMGRIEF